MQQPQNLSGLERTLQELTSHLIRAQEIALKAKEDCRGYIMPTDPELATEMELRNELSACQHRHAQTQRELSKALQEKAMVEECLSELL